MKTASCLKYGALLLSFAGLAMPCLAGLWETPDQTLEGWKEFGWYGWIHEGGDGWIYHAEHGWTYAVGETPANIWFHDGEMGWIWSGEGTYPFLYASSGQEWLYYFRGTREPRYLYHYGTGDWMAVHRRPNAAVTLQAGTYNWRHREYFETEEHQLLNWTRNVVTTTLGTQVLENDLLQVTLLPGWGARILSILYKPFNIELLSYARGDKFSDIIHAPGAFYYDDWLLLPGGINPTFPEGEHGKYWGVPWDFSIVSQTPDAVTVRMSKADDFEWAGHPGKFNNGVTGLVADMDITVYHDRACVEISYTLTNPRNETIPYEFWMAASLAPLPPEQTATSSNLEIIMSQDKLLLRDYWGWMKTVETDDGIPGNDVYRFDQLAWLHNWKGSGIAYAYPEMDNPWWGVINHDYEWGVLRTAGEPDGAPGMKIWGTGANYGMFELWSGHSQEFFADAFMAPLQVKTWKEYFIPTVDLSAITHANSNGAAQASSSVGSFSGFIDCSVFSTWQPANWELVVEAVTGSGHRTFLANGAFSFSSTQPTLQKQLIFHMEALPHEDFRMEAVMTDIFTGEERMRFDIPMR